MVHVGELIQIPANAHKFAHIQSIQFDACNIALVYVSRIHGYMTCSDLYQLVQGSVTKTPAARGAIAPAWLGFKQARPWQQGIPGHHSDSGPKIIWRERERERVCTWPLQKMRISSSPAHTLDPPTEGLLCLSSSRHLLRAPQQEPLKLMTQQNLSRLQFRCQSIVLFLSSWRNKQWKTILAKQQ